ncbi:TPA: dATP/dGTP pyrophosphohydrolase domain-containing protein [Escherichia coli]
MTTITNKKQYPSEQYLNELITNIEFAARAPVEVVRAMAAELQKRREADSAEPVAYIFKHPAGKLFWALTDESNKDQSDVIPVYAAPPVPVVPAALPENDDEDGHDIDYLEPSEVYSLGRTAGWNACRAAMLQGVEPASNHEELSEENGSSLQLRNLIRQRHAEWSDKTFGCVGPVGPLKHLSKEALEAAAEPDDLSEWADMQFLLWDAQRRAGISDAEITAAMENKLKINMERQWPEPKDGEPRLHIKEPGNSPVIPDGLSTVCAEAYQVVGVMADALGVFGDAAVQKVLDNLSQQKLVHRDVLPFSLPVTPDGWISCSERMPDDRQEVNQ